MGYRDGDIPETDDELYAKLDKADAAVASVRAAGERFFGFPQFYAGEQVRIKRDAETVFSGRPGIVESQHPETGTVNVKLAIDSQRYAVALPFAASEVEFEDLR